MSNAGHPDPADEITQDLRPRMPTEPRTAADLGRRNIERYMDHEYGITTNDADWMGLLDGWRDAIEAEARAAALDAARAAVEALYPGEQRGSVIQNQSRVHKRASLAAIDALREDSGHRAE